VFLIVFAVFLAYSKKINKTGPTGSPVVDAFKTVVVGMKEGSLDKAKPSTLEEVGHLDRHKFASESRYTDLYVSQIKSGLGACKVRVWANLDSSYRSLTIHSSSYCCLSTSFAGHRSSTT
jgi:hypothetical protein